VQYGSMYPARTLVTARPVHLAPSQERAPRRSSRSSLVATLATRIPFSSRIPCSDGRATGLSPVSSPECVHECRDDGQVLGCNGLRDAAAEGERAPEEEDEPGQETDRNYWQQKSSPALLKLADQLLDVINDQGPGLSLQYNKCYIGLQRGGMADNFISFRPRKKHMIWVVRIGRDEVLDARLEESGLTMLPYDKRWKQYQFQIVPGDLKAQQSLFTDLIRMARSLPVEPLTLIEADSA
jgi:hypothetical protein